MADEHPKGHAGCKSDEHTRHLCHFVSYGYHQGDEKDYKDLVEELRFLCHFCGRVANNKESLCQPKELRPSGRERVPPMNNLPEAAPSPASAAPCRHAG